MSGPDVDLSPLLWPGEQVVAAVGGRALGAAALRLARLDVARSTVEVGVQLVVAVTPQRLVVVTLGAEAPSGRIDWQIQLPRLAVDLHRLPGQLVILSGQRFVAMELDRHADVAALLAALAGRS